jgi:hypothetical protein
MNDILLSTGVIGEERSPMIEMMGKEPGRSFFAIPSLLNTAKKL